MFVGVQKLELFSDYKTAELGQILDLAGLYPLSKSEFARRNGF